MFGGARGGYLRNTVEWDGTKWAEVTTSGPSSRVYYGMAYDSVRQVTVLFGGWDGNTSLSDTWEYRASAPSELRWLNYLSTKF